MGRYFAQRKCCIQNCDTVTNWIYFASDCKIINFIRFQCNSVSTANNIWSISANHTKVSHFDWRRSHFDSNGILWRIGNYRRRFYLFYFGESSSYNL